MKILLGFFLVFVFAVNSTGSPLIFKATKEVKDGLLSELGTFDATKYSKIRILVERETSNNERGESDYYFVNTYSIDENRESLIEYSEKSYKRYSALLDIPPSKIKITVSGQGKFRLYVWAN